MMYRQLLAIRSTQPPLLLLHRWRAAAATTKNTAALWCSRSIASSASSQQQQHHQHRSSILLLPTTAASTDALLSLPNLRTPTTAPRLSSSSSFQWRGYAAAASREEKEDEQQQPNKQFSGITVARSKGGQSGYCYGCGADLVKGREAGSTEAVKHERTGFWAEKEHDLKKAKIKNWALCPRCKQLRKMDEAGELKQDGVDRFSPDTRMTEVFRREVSKIRTKEHAVVVLCCDAVNVNGSLIKGIRKYVGGNTVLLAVTRCDLLPSYVWQSRTPAQVKEIFRERARDIIPADVYLCSEEKDMLKTIGGIQKLSMELWKHLDGRDLYIVGVANIGKSTLTDILISGFVNKGEELRHFHDRLGFKRVTKLREIRITKSSLPGTTLQNVRVPCFRDHGQALWDTPGLLVDTSLKQFPIRNFRNIRAQRPHQIQPHVHVEGVQRKSLALLISEKGRDDDAPLMRVEIRLKKSAQGEGPIRLVWNSVLENLQTKIVDIEEARQDEAKRMQEQKDREEKDNAYWEEKKREKEQAESGGQQGKNLTKEEKKRAHEEKIRREKAELGAAEWKRREEEKKAETEEKNRFKMLSQMTKIHEVLVERDSAIDLSVANFGWLGVQVPRTAMIRTFAPKTGIQITEYDALALPSEWGDGDYYYETTTAGSNDFDSSSAVNADDGGGGADDSSTGDLYNDNYDFGEYSDFNMDDYDDGDPFSDDLMNEEFGDEFDFSQDGSERESKGYHYDKGGKGRGGDGKETAEEQQRGPCHWEAYRGVNVGYQFDSDMRWNDKITEGWNPIRRTAEDAKNSKGKKEQYHPEDFPVKDHSKYYENPLEF